MKFVVAHTQARRAYAVPAILERAGLLERFYTDICASVGLGKLMLSLPGLQFNEERRLRLSGRRLPENIVNKTRTFGWPNIKYYFSPRRRGSRVEAYVRNAQWQHELGRRMADCGFGSATWLYAFLDEFPTLITAARERGLRVVSEIYILLSADRIVREERRKFPGWEIDAPDYEEIYRRNFGERALYTHIDFALCPSEAVRDDAVRHFGFSAERCRIVPYGVGDSWFEVENRPGPGRILFVGTAELRKGIHHFAMAAERLRARGMKYEFRVAGNVSETVRARPEAKNLNFLGRIPLTEIEKEFAVADVMVLPSLAEGSAEATYQALACRIPVVTTLESGSVVRDGVEGRIVPSREPDALADAIAGIVEDRHLRNQMGDAARKRAKDFTWQRYGDRLIEAITSITGENIQS